MPKERLRVQGVKTLPSGEEELIYTITSNNDGSMFFLNDATGKRLHKADNPLKFDKDIARMTHGR